MDPWFDLNKYKHDLFMGHMNWILNEKEVHVNWLLFCTKKGIFFVNIMFQEIYHFRGQLYVCTHIVLLCIGAVLEEAVYFFVIWKW